MRFCKARNFTNKELRIMTTKRNILNIPVDNISMVEAKFIVENALINYGGKTLKIFTLNPEILLKARKDEYFKEILNRSDLSVADGCGLILAGYFTRNRIKEQIKGIDLMIEICNIAQKAGKSIFLLGGENGVALQTKINLETKFPNLRVVGFSEDENACYNLIPEKNPDIIFVAFGAPKQERWVVENIEKFTHIKVAMVVGGSFDMISGKIKRAPAFFQVLNMEWFWRFLMEPQKRWRRILDATVVFPLLVIIYKLKK